MRRSCGKDKHEDKKENDYGEKMRRSRRKDEQKVGGGCQREKSEKEPREG
jgi:hypothetical protein